MFTLVKINTENGLISIFVCGTWNKLLKIMKIKKTFVVLCCLGLKKKNLCLIKVKEKNVWSNENDAIKYSSLKPMQKHQLGRR